MAKVFQFMANGFEDIEALIPVDVLRRGGVDKDCEHHRQ